MVNPTAMVLPAATPAAPTVTLSVVPAVPVSMSFVPTSATTELQAPNGVFVAVGVAVAVGVRVRVGEGVAVGVRVAVGVGVNAVKLTVME
jgi:hypothetical protein